MIELERSALLIKPTENCLAWINLLPDFENDAATLEEAQADSTVVLIPPIEDEAELFSYLQETFESLFENELIAWCSDESLWPLDRSFSLFTEWFSFELHGLVFDTEEDALDDEELDDDDDEDLVETEEMDALDRIEDED